MIEHDADRLARKFKRLSTVDGVQRVVSPALFEAAEEALRLVKRRNYGFVDRSRKLRKSIRLEQARDFLGRYTTSVQLVAATAYAFWVEWKKRTIDKRPGPPYYLTRAWQLKARRMARRAGELVGVELARELRRR